MSNRIRRKGGGTREVGGADAMELYAVESVYVNHSTRRLCRMRWLRRGESRWSLADVRRLAGRNLPRQAVRRRSLDELFDKEEADALLAWLRPRRELHGVCVLGHCAVEVDAAEFAAGKAAVHHCVIDGRWLAEPGIPVGAILTSTWSDEVVPEGVLAVMDADDDEDTEAKA